MKLSPGEIEEFEEELDRIDDNQPAGGTKVLIIIARLLIRIVQNMEDEKK